MNTLPIKWYQVPREHLMSIIESPAEAEKQFSPQPSLHTKGDAEINVGILDDGYRSELKKIHFLVIDDAIINDLLAWIHVFAPRVAPLSVHGRVLKYSEYQQITRSDERYRKDLDNRLWASIVLGELISQRDVQRKVYDIPLSWVSNCFTTAVAKASFLESQFGFGSKVCLERLCELNSDSKFVRNGVSFQSLQMVWRSVRRFYERGYSSAFGDGRLVDLVVDVLASIDHDRLIRIDVVRRLILSSELDSDSAERRVMAYDKLIADISELAEDQLLGEDAKAITIAAGAFLVGRGTTHLSLIDELPSKPQVAYLWFSFFAGCVGSEFSDSLWFQLVRRIEAQLNMGVDIFELSTCDYYWAEFDWLRRQNSSANIFSAIPKLQGRFLAVEVIPGVVMNARLDPGSPTRDPQVAVDNRKVEGLISRLTTTLSELQDAVVGRAIARGSDDQAELALKVQSSGYKQKKVKKIR